MADPQRDPNFFVPYPALFNSYAADRRLVPLIMSA